MVHVWLCLCVIPGAMLAEEFKASELLVNTDDNYVHLRGQKKRKIRVTALGD